MRETCHGYYDAEPTQEAWDYLRNVCEITSFTYDGVAYTLESTFASTSSAAIIAAVKFACTDDYWLRVGHCQFYDFDTVQASNGQYAFSYSAYLNKFKTLQNDGVTRLVKGSTAGTLVQSVTAWDVCEPNFVVINMCQNDLSFYSGLSAPSIAEDYKLMSSLIKSVVSNVKIAFASGRVYGSLEPSAYDSNVGFIGAMGVSKGNLRYFFEELKNITSQYGDIINLYQTQTVVGSNYASVDTINGKDNIIGLNTDGYIHPVFKNYIDRAS